MASKDLSSMEEFRMNRMPIRIAVLGAMVALLPAALIAQVDPSAASGATSPAGPTGVGPQNGQPGTAGVTVPNPNQPGSMRDSLGAPGQTGQEMLDKQFVRTAAEGGLADVKLGTLAVEKGSPAVKELAQKMVDDHTMMNKDMDSVADALGIMLPKKMNKDGQKEYDKLNGLSGKDFDTEYVTYMLKAHFEDLHAFHMEASVAADQELASEVVKQMGMMHQHITAIVNVAKGEGIALPPRPPKPAPTTASK
jgi:putative membrane protein